MKDNGIHEYGKTAERLIRIDFRGGKSILALCFDTLFMCLLCMLALYAAVRPHFKSASIARLICILVFAAGFALVCAIRAKRFEKHRRKLLLEAAREAARAKLIKTPETVLAMVKPDKNTVVFHGTDSITADDLRRMMQTNDPPLKIVTFAEPTKKASELLGLYESVEVTDPFSALKAEPEELTEADDAEIGAAIKAKYGSAVKKPSLSLAVFALTKERALKYLALGGGLMLLSMLTRYAVYYRVIASAAMSLGAAVFIYEAAVKKEKGAV